MWSHMISWTWPNVVTILSTSSMSTSNSLKIILVLKKHQILPKIIHHSNLLYTNLIS